jgi:hypothetical protein
MAERQRLVRGVLKVRRRNAPQVLGRAKLMEKGLGDHASDLFTDPNPPLPVFSNQIVITDKAQVAATHGGKGMAAARDVQLGILIGMMTSELVVIQAVADSGSRDQAVATLLAGGVEVADVPLHDKPVLAVTDGPTPGSVNLEANASVLLGDYLYRKHFFNWSYTIDGTNFIAMPSTSEARTRLAGLTPLTTVGFRVCVTKGNGVMDPWSQVVEHLVR